ncbi:MAG: hypothetical protein R3D59_19140 [Paracoccaceae bacterium]
MAGVIEEIWKSVATNTLVGAAFYGAVGGLTSGLAINVDHRKLRRHVILGAVVAGGMGTGAGAVMAAWLDIDLASVPAAGATGTMSYLTGVFGPALIEVILGRLRAGRMPNEPGDRGEAGE